MTATLANAASRPLLPILVALFGDAAVLPAVLVIVFDHIVLIPLTSAIIEGSSGGNASWLAIFRRVSWGMARNPLIIATFAGLLCGLTGLKLPVPLDALLKLLSDSAAPCALLTDIAQTRTTLSCCGGWPPAGSTPVHTSSSTSSKTCPRV